MTDHTHYMAGTEAGYKGDKSTGRDAAEAVTRDLANRHKQVFEAWEPYGAAGAIPETVAPALDLPVHVIRPRCCELVKRGLMYENGKSMGGLGHKVTCYTVVRPEPALQAA